MSHSSYLLHIPTFFLFFCKIQSPAFYILEGKIPQCHDYKSIFIVLLSPQELSSEIALLETCSHGSKNLFGAGVSQNFNMSASGPCSTPQGKMETVGAVQSSDLKPFGILHVVLAMAAHSQAFQLPGTR